MVKLGHVALDGAKMKANASRHAAMSYARMKQREPVFGQIEEDRGFGHFLRRGLKNVRGDWALLCTVHNLLKPAAVCSAAGVWPTRGTLDAARLLGFGADLGRRGPARTVRLVRNAGYRRFNAARRLSARSMTEMVREAPRRIDLSGSLSASWRSVGTASARPIWASVLSASNRVPRLVP